MKLICISHWRFPSKKTMTPLILRTCEEFLPLGWEVELWVPRRTNSDDHGQDLFVENGIEHRFPVRRFLTLDLIGPLGTIGFLLMVITFNLSVAARLMFMRRKDTVLYFQDMRDAFLPALLGFSVAIEIHDFYESSVGLINRVVLTRATALIVTNRIKIERLHAKYGYPKERMLWQPNAVDAQKFDSHMNKEEARQLLGISAPKLVLYTGHLFSWKGADTLARASTFLPEDVHIYMVGGTPTDQITYHKLIADESLPRVTLVPHQPHDKMPLYMRAADVLVLPNTAKEEASRLETSPVKLFEYLASGTPVVASDLPSIREIVSEQEVGFATPDEPKSFAEVIVRTLQHGPEVVVRVAAGKEFARRQSWQVRAKNIDRVIRQHL